MVLEILKGTNGFSWQRVATNGRVIDASPRTYVRYREVAQNLRSVGLPCPIRWQRLATKVRRGADRRWRWTIAEQQAA